MARAHTRRVPLMPTSTETKGSDIRATTRLAGGLVLDVSVSIAGRSAAGFERGSGECVDSFVLPDSSVALAIWDASGHGAAAASNTLLTRAAFRTLLPGNGDLNETIKALNRLLCFRASGETPGPLVRGFFAHVDPERRTLRYVSCEHDAVILFDADGTHAHLVGNAPSLGNSVSSMFEAIELSLQAGQVLITATRGIADARPSGATTDVFGVGRICSSFRPRMTDASADAAWLMDEAASFSGGMLTDDAAVCIARFG